MFDYTFQWRAALRALPDMLTGAWVTFETAALSMIFGVLIALALTVMREARHPLLRGFGNGWVSIARNTPALFQIYMAYFGLGSLGIHVSSCSRCWPASPSTMPAIWPKPSAAACAPCRTPRCALRARWA